MNKTLRRSLIALATAFACLVLTATPAAAANAHARITGGNMLIWNATTTSNFTISLSVSCTSIVSMATTPTTAQITGYASTTRFTVGTNHYVAEIILTGSAAANLTNVTATSSTINNSSASLRSDLYAATNNSSTATDCNHGVTRLCRYTMTLGLTGTYTGDVTANAVTDTVTLATSGAAAMGTTPPCMAPFSGFTGGTAQLNAALTLQVCDVTSSGCP